MISIALVRSNAEDRQKAINALVEAKATGDAAAVRRAISHVVDVNQGLVWQVAAWMAKKYKAEVEDAAQYGFEGLLVAIDKFDPTKSDALSTSAIWWIRAYISDGLEFETTIKKPRNVCEKHYKIQKFVGDAIANLGRRPTEEEIASGTGLSKRDIHVDAEAPWITDGFEKSSRAEGGGPDYSLHDMIPSLDPSPEFLAKESETRRKLDGALDDLSPRDRAVLVQRFYEDDITLSDIGESMDLTRERIRQIQDEALGKLRKRLKKEDF